MSASHRIEKVNRERIAHVLRRHPEIAVFATAAKQIGEDVIVEIGVGGPLSISRGPVAAVARVLIGLGILAIEVALGLTLGAGFVDLASIVALALVCVADDVIGGVDLLEALLPGLRSGCVSFAALR